MKKIKINKSGCTQLPTLHQLLTYILYFPNLLNCFLLISVLDQIAIHYSILSILTMISLFSSFKTTLSCPIDQVIIKQIQTRLQGQSFDFGNHKLDSFCEICQLYVQEQTKHCKNCDICCQGFDHHCKWINNCIGNLNYKLFILMISSTLLLFIYTMFIYIYIIVLYQTNYDTLVINNELQSFHFTNDNDLNVKYLLSIIMLTDSSFIVILLLQLLIFHIYLIIIGQTTYDFIIQHQFKKVLPQFQIGPQYFYSASKSILKVNNDLSGLENKNTIIDLNQSQQKIIPLSNQNEIIIENQILT
ncbi:unnamed protein product [Paramecium sonneborni]|uniref:Palmitoyltransferase n=1 Tax=Paramecium sonneborni TaxID=65129 RepID=A0A8S1NFI1_9CILI|nr:unnamed protein product [Paramecium sonneborni]